MKKNIALTSLIFALVAAPLANAGHNNNPLRHQTFYGKAKVVDVQPIYRTVQVSTPQRECWQEEVRTPATYTSNNDASGNMIVGGIIGGVIGHQFGKGRRGRNAATLAGTLIGASIGHDSGKKKVYAGHDHVSYENRCHVQHVKHTEQRIDGYNVTYRYKGEVFQTRMSHEPGKHLQVRVSVTPVFN